MLCLLKKWNKFHQLFTLVNKSSRRRLALEFFRSYLGYDELARKMWLCAFEAKRSASAAVKAFTELRETSGGRGRLIGR